MNSLINSEFVMPWQLYANGTVNDLTKKTAGKFVQKGEDFSLVQPDGTVSSIHKRPSGVCALTSFSHAQFCLVALHSTITLSLCPLGLFCLLSSSAFKINKSGQHVIDEKFDLVQHNGTVSC